MVQQVQIENGDTYEFPDDATPEEMNAQLPASQASSSNNSGSWVNRIANSSPVNFILGAGHPFNNLLTQGYNKLYGQNLQPANFPDAEKTLAYKAGNLSGDVASMVGGGELGSMAMEGLPLVSNAAAYIPKAMQRVAGMAGVGAASDPNSKEGALTGGLSQTAFEAVPYAGKAIGAAYNYAQPQKYLGKILDNLSGGTGLGIEDNGKLLAQNIRNAYNSARQKGKDLYGTIFGDSNISGSDLGHTQVSPVIGISQRSNYENLGTDAFSDYSGETKDAHDNLMKYPTLANAQDLQSKLGSEVGYWQRQRFLGDNTAPAKINYYASRRDILNNDIRNKLNTISPNLANQYDAASNFWRDNVIPFHSDRALKDIAQGNETNPSTGTIKGIFANPNENIQPVVNQIGQEGQNRILFNALGKSTASKNTANFNNAIDRLDEQGLQSYYDNNPELQQQVSSLKSRNVAKNVAEGAAGLGITHMLAPHVPFFGGAAELSGAAAPYILSKFGAKVPTIPWSNSLVNGLANMYRPIGQTYVAQRVLNKGNS